MSITPTDETAADQNFMFPVQLLVYQATDRDYHEVLNPDDSLTLTVTYEPESIHGDPMLYPNLAAARAAVDSDWQLDLSDEWRTMRNRDTGDFVCADAVFGNLLFRVLPANPAQYPEVNYGAGFNTLT